MLLSTATADSGTNPALCVWPPSYNYYCVLNFLAQSGGKFLRTNILPVSDNCAAVSGFAMTVSTIRTTAGATPTLSSGGFACTDTDPRSQLGELHNSSPLVMPRVNLSDMCINRVLTTALLQQYPISPDIHWGVCQVTAPSCKMEPRIMFA